MRERLNRADSKSVEPLVGSVGSNPTLSGLVCALGEMTERPKVHAWKACVLSRVPWVRIPLSPYPLASIARPYAISGYPTPSGPEGSSGKYQVDEMYRLGWS